MPHGFTGAIAHVNLTSREVTIEHPSEMFYRKYMGGRNFIAHTLLRDVPGNTDPLGEENQLIFATGVTTGAPFPGNSRYSVGAKSPLTKGYAESEAGGFFGPELKYAGYDALIISGVSSKPVFLWIDCGRIEIRTAESIWGKDTLVTERVLREMLDSPRAQVACIGPAGENLVLYASIHHNSSRSVNGRLGLGAVMGSKGLKAVAVHGDPHSLSLHDPKIVREKARMFSENFRKNAVNNFLFTFGTWGGLTGLNEAGILPTRNFRGGSFEDAQNIAGPDRDKQVIVGKSGCYACPVACHKETVVDGVVVNAPEYETAAAFGSNCGVSDEQDVVRANRLCNELGMDTISAGNTIAFAMECNERKLLTQVGWDALDLRFGNGKAVLQALKLIARRESVGDLLAEGVWRLSERLGGGSANFAIHAKGEECAMHEGRGKVGVALGYAVGPKGGDHIEMEHDENFSSPDSAFLKDLAPLGWTQALWEGDCSSSKAEQFLLLQRVWGLYAVLDLCIFTMPPGRTFSIQDVVDLVCASTGWDVELDELLDVADRGIQLARLFNLRCGKTAADDALPLRFFQPLEDSHAARAETGIPRDEFRGLVADYYRMVGWDNSGIPTRDTLERLGLGWASEQSEYSEGYRDESSVADDRERRGIK